MIYVMSDIHGEYEKYIEMLRLINFNDDDELYILGDIVDRGPEPIKILQDIIMRSNVFPIMGNHDLMALDILKKLSVDITEDNFSSQVDIEVMNEMLDWFSNGGTVTMEKFRELNKTERRDILDYIGSFPLCDIAETEDGCIWRLPGCQTEFRNGTARACSILRSSAKGSCTFLRIRKNYCKYIFRTL